MSGSIPHWVSRVKPIVDGEQVRASVANRLPEQVKQRTDNLKARLDAAEAGELLMLRDVPMSANVVEGFAVYWNAQRGQYEPALAAISYDAAAGGYTIADSSFAVGIAVDKSSARLGSIGLMGAIQNFDWIHSLGVHGNTPADAGAYYLSTSVAGHITKQKPAVGVYLMYLRGDGLAHLNPTPHEMLEQHIHFAFDLVAEPAGVVHCTYSGSVYEFDSVDVNARGWLPAHYFPEAPVGAKLGYNLAAHAALDRVWPPMPLDLIYIEEDGHGVDPARYRVDANGIWWMEDCFGRAPWPTDIGCPEASSTFIVEKDGSSYCPVMPEMEELGYVRSDPAKKRLRVYFVKMVYKTAASVVTSLKPALNSPITLTDCDGHPAIRGDLIIDMNFNSAIVEGDRSYQAFKAITGFSFHRGPVLTGIKAADDTIAISIPDGTKGALDGFGFYRGEVVISAVSDNLRRREDAIEMVALNGILEDNLVDGSDDSRGLFFLTMPQNIVSSFCGRVDLPTQGLPTNPQLQLFFWVMARATGTLPSFKLATNQLSPPPAVISSAYTVQADLTPPGGTVLNNHYVLYSSVQVPVAAGQEFFFQLKRLVDSYSGDVSIVKMGYIITAG